MTSDSKQCIHHFEYVRTEPAPLTNTTAVELASKDLVICTKCGKTKRI